jgi:hypothetical protein
MGEIVNAVVSAYGPRAVAAQVRTTPGSATVTVVALPGTRISGPAGVEATVGTEGNAAVVLETPAQYTLRAELTGYRPVTKTMFVTGSRVVAITQVPSPRFALDASLFDAGIPNVELSWFFSPGTDFLRAAIDAYPVSLAFDRDGMFFSRPVTELEIQVGHVIGAEDDLFRYTLGFGGFLRTNVDAPFPWLDTSSPGGIALFLGADLRISPSQRFFIEYTPRFYVLNDADAFRSFYIRNPNDDNKFSGWIFGPNEAAALLSFRVGFRWLL